MKKLMIAAAAAAMVGGAYASEECIACGYEAGVTGVNPAFYDVAFKLKTLAPKVVKCGGCEGVAMEQATRTLNGLYWTCDNCVIPYQFALWEKASQTLFTSPISYLHSTDAAQKWSVVGNYQARGYYYSSTFTNLSVTTEQEMAFAAKANKIFGTNYTSKDVHFAADYQGIGTNALYIKISEKVYNIAVPGEFNTEALAVAAAQNYVTKLPEVTMIYVSATTTKVSETPAGECYWQADADPFNMLRYSKKADKVEAFMNQNYTGLEIYAAGFGTYDNTKLLVKSVSGYAVGTIDPELVSCTDDAGNYAPLCDEFNCAVECWDTYANAVQADDTNTYFAGTWTLKINNSYAKKKMVKIVPQFVIGTVDTTCAE